MIDITVEEYNNAIILSLKGEFLFESVFFAEQVWNKQIAKGPAVIAVDCKELDFIDSSAIGILVKFLNQSRDTDIKMLFLDLSEAVEPIFKTARLESFFTFVSREEFFDRYVH